MSCWLGLGSQWSIWYCCLSLVDGCYVSLRGRIVYGAFVPRTIFWDFKLQKSLDGEVFRHAILMVAAGKLYGGLSDAFWRLYGRDGVPLKRLSMALHWIILGESRMVARDFSSRFFGNLLQKSSSGENNPFVGFFMVLKLSK